MEIESGSFVWDEAKDASNILKHGIDFATASNVFFDEQRKIYKDFKHSGEEERLFCIGKVGNRIVTVRFTYRGQKVRIIGAGFWRKGRGYYHEKKNE